MKEKKHFYPLLLDLTGKKILVIGGGNIAARKINNLIDYKADITCIAPDLHIDIKRLAASGKISLLRKAFQPGDVEGFDLVFSATGKESISTLAKEECEEYGAFLNAADDPGLSDFLVPATIKKGCFTISFSSGGEAPFLAKSIKEKTEKILPEHLSDITEIAGKFREQVKNMDYSQEEKIELYDKFLSVDWDFIIKYEGYPIAIRKLNKMFEKDINEEI